MNRPQSTYRLQLNADFRLADVLDLLDYFQQLGISHLYLSPLLQARAGSTHGYDLTDPDRINSEIGDDQVFTQLAAAARERGLGIVLDIVPNHMSATEANPWWRDVMEHGQSSAFAHFFDIDWESDAAGAGRLLLPFLGQSLEQCVADGQLQLVMLPDDVALAYFDRTLPVDAASIPVLVRAVRANHAQTITPNLDGELCALAEQATKLAAATSAERNSSRAVQARKLRNQLASILQQVIHEGPIPLLPAQLTELLEHQPYSLFYWLSGGRHINYRRFFDVIDLAGMRVEDPEVFAALHRRIVPWLAQGTIAGVRIDHIDGLRDPAGYLRRLHDSVVACHGESPYLLVEKILIGDEQLPADWCTAGTTGYDFLGAANGVFIEPQGWAILGATSRELTGITDFTELLRSKKRQVLTTLFAGELSSLVRQLARLLPDAAHEALAFALAEITACLPVYRTYIRTAPNEVEHGLIEEALAAARERGADATVIDWLRAVLLEPDSAEKLDFVLRWQQLTGPAMAKGLEDTAFYNDPRLLSTCEVGCDPRQGPRTVEQFHEWMARRAADWPGTLNASSSHDTKRSEDVRARINVLSELAIEWSDHVHRWRRRRAPLRREVQDLETPDARDELVLYQTMIGAWPLQSEAGTIEQRIRDFMLKAVREAKHRTSWRAENPEYEAAVLDFVAAVLAADNQPFRQEFLRFQERTAFYGALNSLSQLVLKLGAPGIPDFYQGTELWSLTLVDPDNRQPVDYSARRSALLRVDLRAARENWRNGVLKMLVTARGLALRSQHPRLFAEGGYRPVRVVGEYARHIIAFERRLDGKRALFVATRFLTGIGPAGDWPIGDCWRNTSLILEDGAVFRDAVTGTTTAARSELPVSSLLADLPIAILIRRP